MRIIGVALGVILLLAVSIGLDLWATALKLQVLHWLGWA